MDHPQCFGYIKSTDNVTCPSEVMKWYYVDDNDEWVAFDNGIVVKVGCETMEDNVFCIFPFQYGGYTFSKCTRKGTSTLNTPWCATRVDANGAMIEWNYCEDTCPTSGIKNLYIFIL